MGEGADSQVACKGVRFVVHKGILPANLSSSITQVCGKEVTFSHSNDAQNYSNQLDFYCD